MSQGSHGHFPSVHSPGDPEPVTIWPRPRLLPQHQSGPHQATGGWQRADHPVSIRTIQAGCGTLYQSCDPYLQTSARSLLILSEDVRGLLVGEWQHILCRPVRI